MKRFVGQVAVVTGAGRGIGKACALRFAQEGANVACLDMDDAANAQTVEECTANGVEAIAIHCNVADPDNVDSAVQAVQERFSRIDILVASAGVYSGSLLTELPVKQWQRTIDINLTGVFICNRAIAPILAQQGSGSIINIASMAGKTSWPGSAEYSASKSGVIGLTRSVAMEVAESHVTVNAICPGNTKTDMVRFVASQIGGRDGLSTDEWLASRANDCPMKRLAEPWEIAGVAAFLASEDSRYITGQAIEVDGGMVMS
ncbi:MAG: SDR family NAD(P)-dependent oxidoreductase [Anaerolineaceae bacterium]|nr:SDR family NAD(P)-dependent oxidoreductase [Anaerolineaceae bacterium]